MRPGAAGRGGAGTRTPLASFLGSCLGSALAPPAAGGSWPSWSDPRRAGGDGQRTRSVAAGSWVAGGLCRTVPHCALSWAASTLRSWSPAGWGDSGSWSPPPRDCGPHSRGRGASRGWGLHPANSSPLPRVTVGCPSWRQPSQPPLAYPCQAAHLTVPICLPTESGRRHLAQGPAIAWEALTFIMALCFNVLSTC